MNTKQRRVLVAVAIAIAGMMLYPPLNYSPGPGEWVRHGYDWLLGLSSGRVDVGLLLTQFVAIGVIGAIVYYLFADKKP